MTPDACDPAVAGIGPLVLKVGGSIMRQPDRLRTVIEVLGRAQRPVAIVTGGGAFADQVRCAQPQLGFCDETAHRMAILALHQTAWMLKSFLPAAALLDRVTDIEQTLCSGAQAIWLPLEECLDDPDLPATWEATSDAIAARLAERLGGLPLVFLKSRPPHPASRSPLDLCNEGLIDSVSAGILERSGLPFAILAAGTDDGDRLAHLVRAGDPLDAAANSMVGAEA